MICLHRRREWEQCTVLNDRFLMRRDSTTTTTTTMTRDEDMSEMWAYEEPEATDCGIQGELLARPVVLLPRFAAVAIDGVWARASSISAEL